MIRIIPKSRQAHGAFNGGQIVENKPIGFPQDGGEIRPYSNLFYWAFAKATTDSTIQLHPHQGFEIMSFVLKGGIQHYDTKQKQWVPLLAGDAQVIRAGRGIHHAEHMHEGSAMFQIWLDPNLDVTMQKEASYSDYTASLFPKIREERFTKTIFIGEDSPFYLDTKGVEIFTVEWEKGLFEMELDPESIYSLYLLEGVADLNGQLFQKDDFAIVEDLNTLSIDAREDSKIFVISSPAKLNYKTYQEIMQERVRSN